MKTEQLVAKKVKHHFNQKLKQVLFDVISLEEHFDGLLIHKSDIIYLEEGELVNGYVKAGDVNFDSAVSKEVIEPKEVTGMSFEEADELRKVGKLIALPEWDGFWFGNIKTGELLVLTKEGEITDSPNDEFKTREDWIEVEATPEQKELLDKYFEYFDSLTFIAEDLKNKEFLKEQTKTPEDVLEIVVNAETLNLNPEFVEAGIEVGDTIIVDAVEKIEEIIPAKVAKNKNNKKQ